MHLASGQTSFQLAAMGFRTLYPESRSWFRYTGDFRDAREAYGNPSRDFDACGLLADIDMVSIDRASHTVPIFDG
jgi:hypothetical protein